MEPQACASELYPQPLSICILMQENKTVNSYKDLKNALGEGGAEITPLPQLSLKRNESGTVGQGVKICLSHVHLVDEELEHS